MEQRATPLEVGRALRDLSVVRCQWSVAKRLKGIGKAVIFIYSMLYAQCSMRFNRRLLGEGLRRRI